MVLDPVAEWFAEGGRLASVLHGFQPRAAQRQMAQAVDEALQQTGSLIVEAGTGTGKTMAYLVPLLLSGQRALISTGTRNLQDQLFHRDLPLVRSALASTAQVALLKGRANYLCLYRMELAQSQETFGSREQVREFERIVRWRESTSTGDVNDVEGIADDSPVWAHVTSTADNCLGQDCPVYDECFVVRARKQAQEADLVVVNHHLFFADSSLREEGVGELLPNVHAVVFDEAHQLPEVAANFFGEALGSRQILDLSRDIVAETWKSARDMQALLDGAGALEKAVMDFRLAFGEEPRRELWQKVQDVPQVQLHVGIVQRTLADAVATLQLAQGRSKGLDSCLARASSLLESFASLTGKEVLVGQVRWYETFKRSFHLATTPVDIADQFARMRESREISWIYTSATLAMEGDAGYFARQSGIGDDVPFMQLPSPFDYEHQALFYLPRGMPDTSDRSYTQAVIDAAVPVLEASQGRAFLLFTSHRALREAAEQLHSRIPYPVLVQGSGSKHELLQRFRELGNAVLLATGSFWEGVDVRGEALSCVIIDKLPFASPVDPVVQARIDHMRRNGEDAFNRYQMPEAVIALKQGAGRLIRDVCDSGVLVVCDPRLVARPYGGLFLRSLPAMRRTRSLTEVQQFFDGLATK